jgi:phytoene dehydrogenase-like protein
MKNLWMLLLGCTALVILGLILVPWPVPHEPGYQEISSIQGWTVPLPPERPTHENEYDVIVVGSGFGGLACGALLAKDGYRVLIVEKNEHVGGYGSNFVREGFTFSYGGDDITGIWERGSISYLLRELGIDQRKILTRNSHRFIINGDQIDIPPTDNGVPVALINRFPDEADAIAAFFDDARHAYLELFDKTIAESWGVPLRKDVPLTIMPKEWINNFTATHQLMIEWERIPYRKMLDRYFQNDEIKTVLGNLLGYSGSHLPESSALSAIDAAGYVFFGGYRPIGGAQRLAERLAQYITEHRGTVLMRHSVDSIVVHRGTVVGVQINQQQFKAPIVVSSVNAKTLYLNLLAKDALPPLYREHIIELTPGTSAVQVMAGVSQLFPSYPNIIYDMDHHIRITIGSHDDRSSAPLGSSSVTILQEATARDFPPFGSLSYDSKIAALTRKMIDKANHVMPGLHNHLVFSRSVTPHDLEQLTAMPDGAICPFEQASPRPSFKAPIRGLYLANSSSARCTVEAVVISGIICKHDITQWQQRAF